MKAGNRHGVSAILTRGMTVFVLLILSALWLCQIVFLDEFYLVIKKREIKATARTVSNLVSSGNFNENAARSAGEKYGVCFEVYEISEKTAKTLLSADVLPHCAIHNTDERSRFSLYEKAKENGGIYLEYFRFDPERRVYTSVSTSRTENDGEELSMIYAKVSETDRGDILMILNSVVTPVSSAVNTLYVLLTVFTVVIIIFSVLLTRYLSGKITKPIERLTEAADRFGKGSLDTEFRVQGYDEAEKLSDALIYASEEINKTELLRRDFIANISHDLRTPITLITGYSEMMRDIPEENTPENISNIVTEANRLSALVNDVLDYSKLISGTLPLDMKYYNITEQLEEITHSYGEMLKKDGIELTFSSDGEIFVYGDRTKLGRVLINFISNAASHSGENKKIEVRETKDNGFVRISVTDHGEGIPEDKLADIWERYYKVGQNKSRTAGGTGLGLSIVKAIMERHGGAYGVRSSVGVGSEFWYAMKICQKPEE